MPQRCCLDNPKIESDDIPKVAKFLGISEERVREAYAEGTKNLPEKFEARLNQSPRLQEIFMLRPREETAENRDQHNAIIISTGCFFSHVSEVVGSAS